MSGGASAATASGLAPSSVTATTTIKDGDEVPREDAETAARMIRSALDDSPSGWFDMKTFTVKEGLVIDLDDLVIDLDDPNPNVIKIIGRRPDRVHIDLADHSNHLTIWFNAQESMGGRTVENGHGPQYYRTFRELKRGIRNAVLELRNPHTHIDVDSDNDANDERGRDADDTKTCAQEKTNEKEEKHAKLTDEIKSSVASATATAAVPAGSTVSRRLKRSTGASKRQRRRGWTSEQLQRWRRRKHAAARANAKRLHGGAAQPTPT